MVGRVGPDELELDRGPPVPERPGRGCPTACTGTSSRLYREVLAGLRAAGRAADGAGQRRRSTRGASTTACSTAPAPARRRRSTTATRGPRRRSRPVHAVVAARPRCTRGPGSSSCRSTRSTSWPRRAGRRAFAAARTMLLIPDLLGYWLTGVRWRRGDERLDDRAARRPATRTWDDRPDRRRSGSPRGALRAARRARATSLGPLRRRCPRDDRRSRPRPLLTLVGSHDTASAVVGVPADGRPRSPTSPAAPGRSSASSSTQPVLTEASRPANFTNEARRRRPDPLPAQRHGPVAAPGVAPDLGARRRRRRT